MNSFICLTDSFIAEAGIAKRDVVFH